METPTPKRDVTWYLFRIIRAILLPYLIVLLLMVWFEERMIFFPAPYDAADPVWRPTDLDFEDAWFTAADGTRLHGWYCPVEKPRAVILIAHGNAGHLAIRTEVLRTLQRDLKCSVLMFDYRGYGRSNGTPNEQGILQDARAAHDWLRKKTGRKSTEIVLMGRSLGGGVALDLAASEGAQAVVVESTFTSLPDVAALHYPWLPVRLLMRSRLDNLAKLETYQGPLLVSHGDDDEVVPYHFGQQVHESARGDKHFFTVDGGQHNDPQPDDYYVLLGKLLDSWTVKSKPAADAEP